MRVFNEQSCKSQMWLVVTGEGGMGWVTSGF